MDIIDRVCVSRGDKIYVESERRNDILYEATFIAFSNLRGNTYMWIKWEDRRAGALNQYVEYDPAKLMRVHRLNGRRYERVRGRWTETRMHRSDTEIIYISD